jgi:CRISP-associated protein Cas1
LPQALLWHVCDEGHEHGRPAVPTEWRSWPGRYIGRRQGLLGELGAQFTARGAVHPMQAMLNYAVGILAARMTRVVIARGLDASFGFLHDGRKPGRLSLVWDCVEPLRPGLVSAVFGLADGRTFKKSEFGVFSKETIGLLPPLAREVAGEGHTASRNGGDGRLGDKDNTCLSGWLTFAGFLI